MGESDEEKIDSGQFATIYKGTWVLGSSTESLFIGLRDNPFVGRVKPWRSLI